MTVNKKQADELVLRCTDNNSGQVPKPGHVVNLWQWFVSKDYEECKQIVDLALKSTPHIPTIYDLEKARSSLTFEGVPAAAAYIKQTQPTPRNVDDAYLIWRQQRLLELSDEAYQQYLRDRRAGNCYMESCWQQEYQMIKQADGVPKF
jgi:hypothetical protein